MPTFALSLRACRRAGVIGLVFVLFTTAALPGPAWGAEHAAASAPPPGAAPAEPSVDLAARLYYAVHRAQRQGNLPGLTVAAVAPSGARWAESSGTFADGRPLGAGDPVTIGSVTKTFTAAIILALGQEGRIDLDAPARTYLPRAILLNRGQTVRQLLNHTSGIADLYRPARAVLDGAPHLSLSSNAVLTPIGHWFAPGAGYAYSNTNYYLLGLIITSVTGRPFAAELATRITEPLGLAATRLLTRDDTQLPPAWSTAFFTSGAMVATAADLATWGHALYGGNVLGQESLAAMLDFSAGHRYGLGAQLLTVAGADVPGHSGLLYETTTLLVRLPDGLTVALAATAPHADLELALQASYGGPSILELLREL